MGDFDPNDLGKLEHYLDEKLSLRNYKIHNFSPLYYSISVMDEDLAIRIIQEGVDVDLDEPWQDGSTPLHLAATLDCIDVAKALLEANADIHWVTADVHSKFGTDIVPGGQTALHSAAQEASPDMIKLLIENNIDIHAEDFDGRTPLWRAAFRMRTEAVEFMKPYYGNPDIPDIRELRKQFAADQKVARARFKRLVNVVSENLQQNHFTPLWSVEECDLVRNALIETTNRVGWTKKRHIAYATTDIPAFVVQSVYQFVTSSIEERLFPFICEQYGFSPDIELGFRDLFYVKYEALEGEQAYLNVHQDGSIVSFNILLNEREDFEGGGTYFEATGETLCGQKGDCLVHSGKVRHGGDGVTKGIRYVLVGFLSACNRRERVPVVTWD